MPSDRNPVMMQLHTEAGTFRLRVVDSRIIYAVGYGESNETMVLVSNQGKIYKYFAVPKAVHEALLASDHDGSIDDYLRERILGHYAAIQVKRRGRKRHR